MQLVRDVQQVADVCWRVVLQELEVRGEIAGQEPLPDKDQHCAAYSEQGFLCSAGKKVQLKKHRIKALQTRVCVTTWGPSGSLNSVSHI